MVEEKVVKKEEEKKKKREYPLVKDWNQFIAFLQKADDKWEELQKNLNFLTARDLEMEYPPEAQKFLSKFRGVNFAWMLPMLVNYYRGAGGLGSMSIILPPEEKEK